MGHSKEVMRSSGELGEHIRESRSNSLRSTLLAIQSMPEKASSVEDKERGLFNCSIAKEI
jgi:hypothetical protein